MPRAPKETAYARIAELAKKGLGAPAIASELGLPTRTVGRRLAAIRAGKAKPAAAKAARGAPKDADAESETEALAGVDIEHLPAELLVSASKQAAEALRRELGVGGNVVAADKIAAVLERFAKRLVQVRPPEKVDPVKDPANVEARREILARWELLRDPYEVSVPVVDQLQAHVDALRARCAEVT